MLSEIEIREFLWNIMYDFIDMEAQEMIHQLILYLAKIGPKNWVTFQGHLITQDNIPDIFKYMFILASHYADCKSTHEQKLVESFIVKEVQKHKNTQKAIEHIRGFKHAAQEEKIEESLIQLTFYNYFKLVLRLIPSSDIVQREPYVYFGAISVAAFEFLMDQIAWFPSDMDGVHLLTVKNRFVHMTKENCPITYQNLFHALLEVKKKMLIVHAHLLQRRTTEIVILLNNPETEKPRDKIEDEEVEKTVKSIRSDINALAITISQMKGFHKRSEDCFSHICLHSV